MNKKGFTFVELLAVIVILSIITTLTVVSYRNYTKQAKEKELVAVRETIESAYNNYRTKNLYNGGTVKDTITLSELVSLGYIPKGFNYNKEQFSSKDLGDSSITVVKKGSIINNYLYESNNMKNCEFGEMLKYGICKTEVDDASISIDGNNNIDTDSMTFKCVTADAGSLDRACLDDGKRVIVFPSEDDAFCLKVVLTDSKGLQKDLINDIDDKKNKPYCR
jgi:prepilin-type N-terminal cleavage/methylation domain-containing protein